MSESDQKMFNDRFLKELEFLVRCIERMGNNSFKIKRWLSAALILVIGFHRAAGGKIELLIGVLIIIIIVMLCFMDTYYLALEKIYRKRYEWVVENRGNIKDMSIYEKNQNSFLLNPRKIYSNGDHASDCNNKGYNEYMPDFMWGAFTSKVIAPFYLLAASIVIILILYDCNFFGWF